MRKCDSELSRVNGQIYIQFRMHEAFVVETSIRYICLPTPDETIVILLIASTPLRSPKTM